MRLPFYYGWVIVFASFLCFFAFGAFNSYGVFFKPLIEEFGWSRALASSVFSIFAVSYSVSGMIMGRLSDKYGPRKVVMFGGFLVGLGLLLSSQINSLWQLYLFWGIASFGTGAFVVSTISAVVRWFDEKRGLAVGIANSGVGIGIIVLAPVATILTLSYGWRMTFVILGAFFLVLIVVSAFMMQSNPKHTRQVQMRKVDASLSLRQSVFTKPFLMLYVIYFFMETCMTSVFVHIVPLALDIGISSVIASSVLGVIGGSLLFSMVIAGAISDKIGNKNMLTVCLIILAGILFWLIWADNLWMLYVFAIILGFSGSGILIVRTTIVREFFGVDNVGVNLGVLSTTVAVGGVLGPILFGYIFDVSGSYQSGLVFCLLVSLVAAVLSHLLKTPQRETFSTKTLK